MPLKFDNIVFINSNKYIQTPEDEVYLSLYNVFYNWDQGTGLMKQWTDDIYSKQEVGVNTYQDIRKFYFVTKLIDLLVLGTDNDGLDCIRETARCCYNLEQLFDTLFRLAADKPQGWLWQDFNNILWQDLNLILTQ